MNDFKLNTPVAFLIFKRPELTYKVFTEIRKAKPPILLVVADGPRPDHPDEAEKCAAARAIIEDVDWDCEVLKNYSDVNLGCKVRVSIGLGWVFDQVEEAIILEDDCLPHPTFFRFCEELLEYYRNDSRIMAISGDNFQFGRQRGSYSYYFSKYPHIWGWASWQRAWKYFDINMTLWPVVKKNGLLSALIKNSKDRNYWEGIFNSTYAGEISTWDYQFLFSCWLQNGLSILPNVNLVSNIGFDDEATHTKRGSALANMPVNSMNFPLNHPPYLVRDVKADEFTQNNLLSMSFVAKIKAKISLL